MQFEIVPKKSVPIASDMEAIESKGYKNMSFRSQGKSRVEVVPPVISNEEEGRLLLLAALVSYNDIASESGMPLRNQFEDALRCIMAVYGHNPETMEDIREGLLNGIASMK